MEEVHAPAGLLARRAILLDSADADARACLSFWLYQSRQYEAVLDAARQVIRSRPDHPPSYRWLAAALGQLGRVEESKAALEKAIAIGPASFDMYVRNRAPFWRPEAHAHLVNGLRKAGWQKA